MTRSLSRRCKWRTPISASGGEQGRALLLCVASPAPAAVCPTNPRELFAQRTCVDGAGQAGRCRSYYLLQASPTAIRTMVRHLTNSDERLQEQHFEYLVSGFSFSGCSVDLPDRFESGVRCDAPSDTAGDRVVSGAVAGGEMGGRSRTDGTGRYSCGARRRVRMEPHGAKRRRL